MNESITGVKACNRCGEIKPLDDYHRHPGTKDGRRGICKTCTNAASSAYREENAEVCRERTRAWQEANKEYRKEYQRAYTQSNAEKIRARNKEYRAANADKVREWRRASYHRNAEAIREGHRERRRNNPEYARAYREANAERIRELRKRWHENNYDKRRAWLEANADKTRAYANKRRALKASQDCGCVTGDAIAQVTAAYGNACVYCGSANVQHMDHVVPLSKGGIHCVNNLRPACSSCNLAKFNFDLDDFLRRRPDLSGDLARLIALECPNGF